jgi:hypothetical protein
MGFSEAGKCPLLPLGIKKWPAPHDPKQSLNYCKNPFAFNVDVMDISKSLKFFQAAVFRLKKVYCRRNSNSSILATDIR